jgi:hypothetical protein
MTAVIKLKTHLNAPNKIATGSITTNPPNRDVLINDCSPFKSPSYEDVMNIHKFNGMETLVVKTGLLLIYSLN